MQDWSAFIRRHTPAVWKTVYRVLGNETDAADAFQETFIAALALEQKQPVSNWDATLRHLASARAIDLLRRRLRDRRDSSGASDWDAIAGSQPSPENRSEDHELVERLRQLVAELPTDQAELYCLRFIHEWSYRQIADQLGMTENAVGVALNRIRGWLAQRMHARTPQEEIPHEEPK